MTHLIRAGALALLVLLLVVACQPAAAPSAPTPETSRTTTQAGASQPRAAAAGVAPTAATGGEARQSDRDDNASAAPGGPTPTFTPRPPETPEIKEHNTPTPVAPVAPDIKLTTVVDGILLPMAMQFAPDGRMFFNEVSKGEVRILKADGTLQEEPFVKLRIALRKEMGVLGLALDPSFRTNHYVYIFYSNAKNDRGDPADNRVVRYTERDGQATDRTVIIKDLPTGICCHNGGRIGFGVDGKLYVTVGDTNDNDKAQKLNQLHGKVLRLNPDGSIPDDNPFPGSPVYALGFRNPYGLAFHPTTGVPYVSENGEVGHDEINRVVAGGNYGNGVVDGTANDPRFIDPIWESDQGRVAPVGGAFYTGTAMPEYTGDFFFCAYNTGDLTRMRFGGPNQDHIEAQEVVSKACFLDVANAPDGSLYLANVTSIVRWGR
ncbi:MAG: PQQ-dependent sugar dehydrogenase [Chloroflexi bacterium]|nr:PQQ-dependent sugar dehydrogenase [Chloroflexota bacterium]